jgi:hypothetical protein
MQRVFPLPPPPAEATPWMVPLINTTLQPSGGSAHGSAHPPDALTDLIASVQQLIAEQRHTNGLLGEVIRRLPLPAEAELASTSLAAHAAPLTGAQASALLDSLRERRACRTGARDAEAGHLQPVEVRFAYESSEPRPVISPQCCQLECRLCNPA